MSSVNWDLVLTLTSILAILIVLHTNQKSIETSLRINEKSIKTTEKSTNIQLVKSTLTEYASDEMHKALEVLGGFLKECPSSQDGSKAIAQGYARLRAKFSNYSTDEVHSARRRVKYFFVGALIMKKAGWIDQEISKEITNVAGLDLLFKAVEPLDVLLSMEDPDLKYDENLYEEIEEFTDYKERSVEQLRSLVDTWKKYGSLPLDELDKL